RDVAPGAVHELAIERALGRGEVRLEQACDVGHGAPVLGSPSRWMSARSFHHAESAVTSQAFFASCPRGLEALLAEELGGLGARATEPLPGGGAFARGPRTLSRR